MKFRFIPALLLILPSLASATCFLETSTADTGFAMGPFVDETDGDTVETALTITSSEVLIKKKGSTTFAAKNEATSCTHRSNGWYTCPLDTTDTNTAGNMIIQVNESGALPVWRECYVNTVQTDVTAILTDTGTTLDTALATVDSNVDAILVDTGTTLDAALAVVDGNVDSILVDTGTTLDAALAVVDANVDSVLADTGTDGVVLANDSITAAKIAADSIGASEIAADAIGSSELATTAATEIWDVQCEDQGGGYSCREAMSLILAEGLGTCVYSAGSRTWVCSDPSGTETRFTIIYGTDLDGDRDTSTPAPFTP